MKNIKKGILALCFGLASAGYAASINGDCCSDPLNASPSDLTYRALYTADIKIPTYNQRMLADGRIQFDIHRNDFSALKFMFSRTMALYGKGEMPRNTQSCPYIKMPSEYIQKQYLSSGIIRVTMLIKPEILDIVQKRGCVITDRPAP